MASVNTTTSNTWDSWRCTCATNRRLLTQRAPALDHELNLCHDILELRRDACLVAIGNCTASSAEIASPRYGDVHFCLVMNVFVTCCLGKTPQLECSNYKGIKEKVEAKASAVSRCTMYPWTVRSVARLPPGCCQFDCQCRTAWLDLGPKLSADGYQRIGWDEPSVSTLLMRLSWPGMPFFVMLTSVHAFPRCSLDGTAWRDKASCSAPACP